MSRGTKVPKVTTQAPETTEKFVPGMDTSNFPASALSTPLIGIELPISTATMREGIDFEAFTPEGLMIPKFTKPTAEKLAAGKEPFPYISFSDQDGKKFRAYGSLALAISAVPFVDGSEADTILTVISITEAGEVTCHENEF